MTSLMTIQLRIFKSILHFMIKPSKNIRHGHSFDINSSDKGQTSCGTRRLETLLNFPIRHIKRIFYYVHINIYQLSLNLIIIVKKNK